MLCKRAMTKIKGRSEFSLFVLDAYKKIIVLTKIDNKGLTLVPLNGSVFERISVCGC